MGGERSCATHLPYQDSVSFAFAWRQKTWNILDSNIQWVTTSGTWNGVRNIVTKCSGKTSIKHLRKHASGKQQQNIKSSFMSCKSCLTIYMQSSASPTR